MLLTMSIILLVIGLWAAWIGLKACEQVYGIALLLTGGLVIVWSLFIAPLWFQILVEFLLLGLSQFVDEGCGGERSGKNHDLPSK